MFEDLDCVKGTTRKVIPLGGFLTIGQVVSPYDVVVSIECRARFTKFFVYLSLEPEEAIAERVSQVGLGENLVIDPESGLQVPGFTR